MNVGGFNSTQINGAILDVSVRSIVNLQAYAQIVATGRMLVASPVQSLPQAVFPGSLGSIRSPGAVYEPLTLTASANVTPGYRMEIRPQVDVTASALISMTGHMIANEVRNPYSLLAQAYITLKDRVLTRSPLQLGPAASVSIMPRALIRGSMSLTPTASITVSDEVIKHGIYDFDAPDEYTYIVPFEDNIFYVRDEMPLIGTIRRQPADIRDYDANFSEWFPSDDPIITAEVTVLPAASLTLSYAISTPRVKVWVQDGASGVTSKVSIRASTRDGRRKEVELKVITKDI